MSRDYRTHLKIILYRPTACVIVAMSDSESVYKSTVNLYISLYDIY